ncbi:hypothetical protein F5I97DRAFT_2005311 [Phlebopus sp. FC_14]|nr:hypothetical protein F5I97DRAFT_2005311 [Phlebopus sp. FC_14]
MRPTKRRKLGLNIRFDRMIEKVNLAHSFRASSSTTSRRRTRSSGNSSVSSYEVPKTPVDAHDEISQGRLGRQFSVLKMNKSMDTSWAAKKHFLSGHDSDEPISDVAISSSVKRRNGPLPDWLAETFSTLDSEHPLRCLLSPSRTKAELTSQVAVERSGHEGQIFAFSIDGTQQTRDVFVANQKVLPPSVQESAALSISDGDATLCYSECRIPQAVEKTPDLLPFSAPGCFAPKRKLVDTPPRGGCFAVPDARHLSGTREAFTVTYDAGIVYASASLDLPTFCASRPGGIHEHRLVPHSPSCSDPRENSSLLGIEPEPPFDQGPVNVYTTPGPNFAHSRPVYFDSPTENPSFSNPIQPDAYELDLQGIDFRWQPFLRSNKGEGNARKCSDSDSEVQFFAPVAARAPSVGAGNNMLITAGFRGTSTTVEDQEITPTFPTKDPDESYLGFSPEATQENNLAPDIGATIPGMHPPPVSSEARKTEVAFAPAPGIFVSPLCDRLDPSCVIRDSWTLVKQEVLEENISSKLNLPLVCLESIHPGLRPD